MGHSSIIYSMKFYIMKKLLGIVVLGLLFSIKAYSASITEELSKLNDLYKSGALTEEEFSKAKSNLLNKSEDNKNLNSILTLSEEDALKAQIYGCWSIPLGLPFNENLLVRIKLKLKPDGTISETEILDHHRMNQPGQGFYKVLVESVLRALKLCQPLRVPTSGYERWK